MESAFRYLKWNDVVVGLIAPDLSVRFVEPRFNATVGLYTHGQATWTSDQFLQFLAERIMSPARRDIERLLFRCGLSEYDVFKIADATHAINPRDELWMSPSPDALMTEAATNVFDSVFLRRIDASGRSLFYEDMESFARKAAADPRAYATTFGYVGTYWNHACDIAARGVRFGDLLNLDLSEGAIRGILVEAGFTGYRLEAGTEWIVNALGCLKELG